MAKRHRRLGTILGALGLALVMTGPASAALTPRLSASTSPAGSAVSYSQAATDDPVAKITYYVPSGFTALLAQPAGEVVGTVSATALAADLGNATLPLRGTIVAADATTTVSVAGQQVPLSVAATQCTGTATHGAFWILNLTASGQTLQVPAYVDDVPLTVPLSDIANNTIQICLPPPDVPAGTPGRATFGAKLVSATFISEVFSVPPGSYTWRAVVTPYTPGRGTANPAGTVEAQSVDRTPQQVTIAGRAVRGKVRTVRVTGRVRAATSGVAGVRVQVLLGTRVLGRATTRAGGVWTTTVRIPTATALLRASATARGDERGSVHGELPAGAVRREDVRRIRGPEPARAGAGIGVAHQPRKERAHDETQAQARASGAAGARAPSWRPWPPLFRPPPAPARRATRSS